MSVSLVALHLPPTQLPRALRDVWDEGDAALPLPWGAPDAARDELVRRLRPGRLVRAGDDGASPEELTLPDARHLPEGSALVLTTSGSTGVPKGVVVSHTALAASTTASVARLGAEPGDRFALALPLHHIAGLQVVLRAWACGTQADVVTDPGDPGSLASAAADHLSLVPTQLARLLDDQRGRTTLARWRSILVGGAALDARLADRATALHAPVVTSYGMTETCGGCVYDGRPLDGVEVAIGTDRRIRIRGPVVCSGYLDPGADALQEAVGADGWFTTADAGVVRDGRLHVLGRVDDTVISGGENVPVEVVATTLRTHAAIADVAVTGVPDAEWGQRVVAVVVPTDPDVPPDLETLRDLVRRTHPTAYAPQQLVLTTELPRDAMGKVSVAALRRLAERT